MYFYDTYKKVLTLDLWIFYFMQYLRVNKSFPFFITVCDPNLYKDKISEGSFEGVKIIVKGLLDGSIG